VKQTGKTHGEDGKEQNKNGPNEKKFQIKTRWGVKGGTAGIV